MRQMLSKNATAIFLQNATKVYYKMRRYYHKMWQLVLNASEQSEKKFSVFEFSSNLPLATAQTILHRFSQKLKLFLRYRVDFHTIMINCII